MDCVNAIMAKKITKNKSTKTDEEKILFNDYVYLSTIQRYFSLSKIDATDLFIKAQKKDESNGYLQIYRDRVRSEAVFELLGLNIELALKRYEIKNEEIDNE